MATKKLDVESVGEAYLALLKARGIDYIFANGGTDFAPVVEGLARAQAKGIPMPETIPIAHENCAIGMAHGYYIATGRPQAVMVHVTVGTANAICNLMNATRENVPIFFCAGRTPIHEDGVLGARSNVIHWAQEMFDQAGMLRELVKWDYELRDGLQLETVVDRALSISMSEPKGPIYLSLPREVLAGKMDGLVVNDRVAAAEPTAPNPAGIERAAQILAQAQNPLIITAASGVDQETVPLLAKMAERFALPVVEFRSRYVCLPSNHPMHLGGEVDPYIVDADAILVLDTDVPWLPFFKEPKKGCKLIQIGPDPLFSRIPIRSFNAEVAIASTVRNALGPLTAALRKAMADKGDAIEKRRKKIAAEREKHHARIAGVRHNGKITKAWLSKCVSDAKTADTIVVNEYPLFRGLMSFTKPGTWFGAGPAGGLGWGLPAALGVQLAKPDATVISACGDGSYMFANPVACHQVSEALKLPVLTVVCNNRRWNAVRMAALEVYPDGAASRANRMPITSLEPSPRFEKVVEASGGYGERVEEPDELPAALERAMKVVKQEKRQALLNVITE
jgi:acetolactate synthase-1/2/3 large subunit